MAPFRSPMKRPAATTTAPPHTSAPPPPNPQTVPPPPLPPSSTPKFGSLTLRSGLPHFVKAINVEMRFPRPTIKKDADLGFKHEDGDVERAAKRLKREVVPEVVVLTWEEEERILQKEREMEQLPALYLMVRSMAGDQGEDGDEGDDVVETAVSRTKSKVTLGNSSTTLKQNSPNKRHGMSDSALAKEVRRMIWGGMPNTPSPSADKTMDAARDPVLAEEREYTVMRFVTDVLARLRDEELQKELAGRMLKAIRIGDLWMWEVRLGWEGFKPWKGVCGVSAEIDKGMMGEVKSNGKEGTWWYKRHGKQRDFVEDGAGGIGQAGTIGQGGKTRIGEEEQAVAAAKEHKGPEATMVEMDQLKEDWNEAWLDEDMEFE